MTTNPRKTPGYAAWVRQVLKHCEPTCIRCGYPVDMTLPPSHIWGPTADHEPPLIETGEATPGLDGAGIAHNKCNKSHGGRLGAARAQTNTSTRPPKKKTNTMTNKPAISPTASVFSSQSKPPPAPCLSDPQQTSVGPDSGPLAPVLHADGWVMPRLESMRPGACTGSYGEQARRWIQANMRMVLRGWQAYALDRALEHDQDGRLIWRTVIVTVGRQSGKSVLSRALCMWRLHHAELLGGEQTILHVANRRQTAVEVFRPAGLWAQAQYGRAAVKWGNNNTQIELPSGDRWIVQAANENAGVGYSISMAFIDEAWRVQRDTVDDAIWPTMAERDNPQLWLVSTAGDSRSDLMAAYRQQAIDQMDAPRDTLILEWSAPPGADITEVSTWMWGSPEWNTRRKAFVRGQFEKVEPDAFRRQFLNQWTILANHWLPERHWNETQTANQDLPAGTWHVAVESDFDGSSHAVAVAATDEQGLVHVRVTAHPTLKDVDEQLTRLRKQNPTMHVLVTPGYVDRLRTRFDGMVGQREAVVATQVLMDLFNRRLIRHDGASLLREQIFGTTIAKRQHGWVMTAPKGSGGVHAARAVMFAAWDASKAPRPIAVIRSRARRGA